MESMRIDRQNEAVSRNHKRSAQPVKEASSGKDFTTSPAEPRSASKPLTSLPPGGPKPPSMLVQSFPKPPSMLKAEAEARKQAEADAKQLENGQKKEDEAKGEVNRSLVEPEGVEPADYGIKKRVIEGKKAKNGGYLEQSDVIYIKQVALERGYYLSSDISILTNKPFSPDWATSNRKSAKDLSINVRQDNHENGQTEDEAANHYVRLDAPQLIHYIIPEEALAKIITPQRSGTGDAQFMLVKSGFDGIINDNTIGQVGEKFQGLLVENIIQSDGGINVSTDYRIKIDFYFSPNTNQEIIDKRISQLKQVAISSGYKPENIIFNSNPSSDNQEHIMMESGNNHGLLIVPGK